MYLCVHSVVWLPMLKVCNVRKDALNACHSAQGCGRVCTESWLRKKSLAAPGNWTCMSSALCPWHSTSLTTSHSRPLPPISQVKSWGSPNVGWEGSACSCFRAPVPPVTHTVQVQCYPSSSCTPTSGIWLMELSGHEDYCSGLWLQGFK